MGQWKPTHAPNKHQQKPSFCFQTQHTQNGSKQAELLTH
jgi:hypothetical protein